MVKLKVYDNLRFRNDKDFVICGLYETQYNRILNFLNNNHFCLTKPITKRARYLPSIIRVFYFIIIYY